MSTSLRHWTSALVMCLVLAGCATAQTSGPPGGGPRSSASADSAGASPAPTGTPSREELIAAVNRLRQIETPAGFDHSATCPAIGPITPASRQYSACFRVRTQGLATTLGGLNRLLAPLHPRLNPKTFGCGDTTWADGNAQTCVAVGTADGIPVAVNVLYPESAVTALLKFEVLATDSVSCKPKSTHICVAG